MGNLLYLTHRLPFPPNKGDKVRSFHLLQHLLSKHRVYLGTFIDDPEDEAHVATVRAMCAGLHVARLDPRWARLRSVRGLFSHEALTLGYYHDGGLARWVDETLRRRPFDAAVVFSSSMAQYVERRAGLAVLVDFVDVYSAKWSQYAGARPWPLSWLYRREGRRLLAYERSTAVRARRSFFVTDDEAALFRRLAPECSAGVESMGNGVDTAFFSRAAERVSPYPRGESALVFTGAMDYWPNIDAVRWFAAEIMPLLALARLQTRLYIVGRNPPPAVKSLAGPLVSVTGTVPDVRPYLQHACVAVAPLRLARGIQNKVLEAMAMACPVVASRTCAASIQAEQGRELFVASDANEFASAIMALLADPHLARKIGAAGRQRVLRSYGWRTHLSKIDAHLPQGELAQALG